MPSLPQLSSGASLLELACALTCLGALPLTHPEWNVIRRALSGIDAPQFVLVSSSGATRTKEAVGFPVAVCLVWCESGQPFFESLLRKLTQRSYFMQPEGFDELLH
jgi:hypothetical protein